MATKFDLHQEITNKLIAVLEKGTIPWRKPWNNPTGGTGLPVNHATSKPYHGMNVVLLWSESMCKGYNSNRWGTYKQLAEQGLTVRKGEKSTMVVFYRKLEVKDKVTGEDKEIPMLRYFNVFNVEQTSEYVAPVTVPTMPTVIRSAAIDSYVTNCNPEIRENKGQAYFHPMENYIGMPKMESFHTTEGYYATLIHELVHWTGHKSRLDRLPVLTKFGSESYAAEELIAELGAAFVCAELGLSPALENHASYLQSWLKVLKNDKKAIFTASSQASKASQYLEGLQPATKPASLVDLVNDELGEVVNG